MLDKYNLSIKRSWEHFICEKLLSVSDFIFTAQLNLLDEQSRYFVILSEKHDQISSWVSSNTLFF